MRAVSIFFLYLTLCLAIAAALTCPLVQTGWIGFQASAVMGRLTQLVALLGLWPLLRWLGLAERGALGYGVARGVMLRAVALGWLLGALMLLPPVLAFLGAGVLVPQPIPSWGYLVDKSTQALSGGIMIALLEETFFRGVLWGAVRRTSGVAAAALGTSALYAVAHFVKPHPLPDGMTCAGAGGWQLFAGTFSEGVHGHDLDSLAALFAAGVLLGLVRERTGHIGWCIGLHAGWVWLIQTSRRVTEPNHDSPFAFLVGCYDEIIGWAMAAWVVAVILVYWYRSRPGAVELTEFRPAASGGCRPGADG